MYILYAPHKGLVMRGRVSTYSSAVIFIQLLLQVSCTNTTENFKTIDVAKLSKLERGTELVLLEKGNYDHQTYRLEDFFWTGSGDGNSDGNGQTLWESESATTVYKTKTILSTIYVQPASTNIDQNTFDGTTDCSFNCDGTVTFDGEINPTPTYDPTFYNSSEYIPEADRQFWLLTVLKTDGKNPILTDLKNSLAKLYKTAFQRQQEIHLGISGRSKRAVDADKPVNVFIINVTKSPLNGNEAMEVLYHVSVSGQPVTATTAAADMHLVSDEEVTNELGYPFIIKAEPYLKVAEPQYLARSNNTWVFIGVALAILFVLLLLVAFLTLAMSKRSKTPKGLMNKKQVFNQGVGTGNSNITISDEIEKCNIYHKKYKHSPTYINFRTHPSNETLRSGIVVKTPGSTTSSSTYGCSSLDISPLMNKRQPSPPKRQSIARPKAALNKTAPMVQEHKITTALDSDSSSDKTEKNSIDTILIKTYDPGIMSPKSYLSMPSVKSFPRGNNPEPLNKVLEPVSVLHLDLDDDESLELPDASNKHTVFTRYGSLSAIEDPGIIGPVVWSEHCKRLQRGTSVDEGIDDTKLSNNATRMRKRFHELLDETFSLFGSRRESPVEDGRIITYEVKSHSAVINRPSGETQPQLQIRPKTSDVKRPASNNKPPRGAWSSNTPSPLVRPLSAGPFQRANVPPQVNINRILTDGSLPPNDPAVPLIAAIKTELGKCSLPGSTTNLVE